MRQLEDFVTDPIAWLSSWDHLAYVLLAVLLLLQIWRYVCRENGWDTKCPWEE